MFLDSWAWIEIFQNSTKGQKINSLVKGKELYTSVLNLAEVAFWCVRNGKNHIPYISSIKANCTVLTVYDRVSIDAGVDLFTFKKHFKGMGMIDAIIYQQAVSNGLKIVTGDSHFANLPNVEFIK